MKRGDVILTSGDGGLYPRGLPVGVADKDIFGQWRVRLYSDRSALDYVRVMLFTDFSQLVDDQALNNREPPSIGTAEKAQIDQAVAARMASPRPGSIEAKAQAEARTRADAKAQGEAPGAPPPKAAGDKPVATHGAKPVHPAKGVPGHPAAVVPGRR